MWTSNKGLLQL